MHSTHQQLRSGAGTQILRSDGQGSQIAGLPALPRPEARRPVVPVEILRCVAVRAFSHGHVERRRRRACRYEKDVKTLKAVSGLKRLRIGVLNAPRCLVLGAVAALAAGCGGGGSTSAAPAPQTVVTAPPTISGTPQTSAQVGVAYSFTPTASGASGAALTFSISNKPSWATFNSSTGNLAGTPGSSNVGTISGIIIGVSNGTSSASSSASLPAFSVTVAAAASNPPATGSVTVSWAAPTTNTDGSAAALTGYRLYYGTSPTDLSHTIDINNPSQLSQLVGNLSAATWYFAVASLSSTGAESVLSNPVSATVK